MAIYYKLFHNKMLKTIDDYLAKNIFANKKCLDIF